MQLRKDATYLIVGGLGGIGRSICHWMASHGARNIVVLSRSANSNTNSYSFINELSAMGVKVMPVGCDVSDAEALNVAVKKCQEVMPPIRGIIQGAMVLQVSKSQEACYY